MASKGKSFTWCVAGIAGAFAALTLFAARDVIRGEWLLRRLDSKVASERESAVVALGRLRYKRAVPRLAEGLRRALDPEPKSTRDLDPGSVETALLEIGGPAHDRILELAADPQTPVSAAAQQLLERFRPPPVPTLVRGLEVRELRRAALRCLSNLGDAALQAVPRVIQTLDDADLWCRLSAMDIVARLADASADLVPPLFRRIEDPGELSAVWGVAIDLAAKIGAPAAPAARDSLHHPGAAIRARAAQLVGKLGAQFHGATEALVELLEDPEWRVREAAMLGLSYLGPSARGATPTLIRQLGDKRSDLRAAALHALAAIGIPDSEVPSIARLLEGDEEQVAAAAEALAAAGKEARELVPDLARALERTRGSYRAVVAETLEKLGPDASAAAPALVKALADPRWSDHREAAMKALVSIGTAAVPAVAAALDCGDTREATAQALVACGLKERDGACKLLAGVLASGAVRSDAARDCAVTALAKLDAAAAFGELERVAGDPGIAPLVRIHAIEALGGVGCGLEKAAPKLVQVLEEGGEGLPRAAAIALGGIERAHPAVVAALEATRKKTDLARLDRACAALSLVRLGVEAPGAQEEFTRLLKDPAASLEALRALRKYGNSAASFVPAVSELLRADTDAVVIEAAGLLGGLGDVAEAALPALREVEAAHRAPVAASPPASGQSPAGADVVSAVHGAIARIEESNDKTSRSRLLEQRLRNFREAKAR